MEDFLDISLHDVLHHSLTVIQKATFQNKHNYNISKW
jgi:hypothetical protein